MMFAMMAAALVVAEAPPCKTFAEIYGNGKNLCEKMWGDAFVYVKPEDGPAYDMWWGGGPNPNDDVTKTLHDKGVNFFDYDPEANSVTKCLDSHHKHSPSPTANMTECQVWSDNNCCKKETVRSADALNEAYGKEYHWNRCGELSDSCKRYFVYEACLYECDPAAALWRRFLTHENATAHPRHYNNSDPNERNKWELYKMPIKAGTCDGWYEACKNDLFCSLDSGNYFSCAKEYVRHDNTASNDDDSLPPGWIAVISGLCVLFLAITCYLIYIITKEKQGKPVFYQPVAASEAAANHPEAVEMSKPESTAGQETA